MLQFTNVKPDACDEQHRQGGRRVDVRVSIRGDFRVTMPHLLQNPTLGVDMEAQKCLRNSGFLPPLAADGVYDHDCAVPSTVRHAGRAQERPAREVSASFFSKKTKNVPIQGLLTWLSLLAFGCS